MNLKFLAVIFVLIAGLVGVGLLTNGGDDTSGGTTDNADAISSAVFAKGDPNSKVVVTEALDFGCGVCAQFHASVLTDPTTGADLYEEYSDRIRVEIKHFPIPANGNSVAAHRAAVAAAAQGKFWEMHDILYERREQWIDQATTNPIPQFETFAEELGLDVAKFKVDFASRATNERINKDKEEMQELGVSGTPTFYINGQQISNNEIGTSANFRTVIEKAIADANGTEQTPADAVEAKPEEEAAAPQ